MSFRSYRGDSFVLGEDFMEKKVIKLQKAVNQTNLFEWQLSQFNKESLKLIGSFNLSYYHSVEVVFYGVSYIECPTYFQYPRFRLATNEENERLKVKDIEYEIAFCIEEEDLDLTYYICARGFNLEFCTVYHYRRENLTNGERIADWVK